MTSNGTGLGHLTRSLAIARRLDPAIEPLFVTLSAAAPVVGQLGYPVEYVASYDRPGVGNDISWTFRTRDRLRAAVTEAAPSVVVFDGTHPYERLLPALRASGARLIWCRRALWRDDADTAPLHRTHLFDAVLEPGELGAGHSYGPTARRAEATLVDPIVLLDRAQLAWRVEAERELGLAPGRRNVLIQLGQGAGVREAVARCVRHLVSRGDVQVAALSSQLAGLAEVPAGVVRLHATYPIARFFAAFDAAVSAAGYNAAHELVGFGVPALLVPMERQTDDQARRALEAQRAGLALACTAADDPNLERRLDELLEERTRARIGAALRAQEEWRGAEQAARWINSLIQPVDARARGGDAGATTAAEPGAARRNPGLATRLRRAWIFFASVPRTLARVVSQTLGRPSARVQVLALGVPPDRLGPALERTLAELDERPERVLVVTDQLDFAPLLAAGVGFEHIPAQGERQGELAGVPYASFREARLALIRARRPRPRRVIQLGEDPAAR